jgi:hypothetical protein
MAKTYASVVGGILLVLGVAGFLLKDLVGTIHFVPAQNIFHIASGVVGVYSGVRGKKLPIAFARVFGLVYTVVAILGFMHIGQLSPLELNATYNVVHLAVGLLGLAVGFKSSKPELARAEKSGA